MTKKERRQHPRVSTINLISYNCIDETDQVVSQGMGRTLNVSSGGILLETHVPIDPKYIVALSIGLKDELININGRVIYSMSGQGEKFEAGIQFLEKDEAALEILKKYIKAFKEQ